MKIEKKMLPNATVELTIEETVENIAKYRKNVMSDLKKNADIKGFRKWSEIPEWVILKNYGEERIQGMVVEKAIDDLFQKALRKEEIVPVAQAVIKEVASQSPLKFIVEIEIMPEVEISDDYKKISLEKSTVGVSDEEVQAALDDIQQRFTKFEKQDATYEAQMWDKLTIDTDGFDEKWVMLESTSMRAYALTLGSNILVPGFEEQLVWAKKWDEKELDVNFPKDYHNAEFAWLNTKFKVTVHEIEKAVKPEFTPEFIEQLRGKELDLAGFKKLVHDEILDTKISNARMKDEEELINELLKISKVEVGEKLLEANTEKVFTEIKENLAKDQVKVGDYLESLKMDEDQYKKTNVEPIAQKRLQGELLLSKLSEKMEIYVDDATMETEIDRIASRFENPEVLERLKSMYAPGTKQYEELKQRLRYSKIIDSFFTTEKKPAMVTAKKTTAKKK